MKRWWIAFIVLIFLAACAKTIPISEIPQSSEGAATGAATPEKTLTVTLPAKFKLISDSATRNPPVINGIVKNIGNGTGSVKVTAKVYYASVVSGENYQILENIAPGDQKSFSIPIEKVDQWTSFKVFLE